MYACVETPKDLGVSSGYLYIEGFTMAVSRNNLLIYFADLQTVGGAATLASAIGILLRYDVIVIKPQTSGNLSKSIEIIYALKQIKPGLKIFGWTDLGNAANVAAWQATVDQWRVDIPSPLLSGIFIDNFGFNFATSTRTNQNTAITYCHTNSLAAFVSCTDVVDALGTLPLATAPVIGRHTVIVDTVLLPNFFYVNANSASPSLEVKEDLTGRAQYLEAALVKTTSPQAFYNLTTAVDVGVGTGTGISSDAYIALLNTVNTYGINFLSVNPFDFGASSNKYFYKYRPNTFSD